MRDDRTEILLRADAPQVFDDIVAQLCKLELDIPSFQRARQRTQYASGGGVDGGHDRTIEHHRPKPARRIVGQFDDLPPDVFRIEIEPGARAAYHEGAGRIAGTGISGAVDEASGVGFASEGNDGR